MSSDNKDEFFNLLAHEKIISDLYQNNKQHQVEEPSAQIDSGIMAMAKQQLSGNASLVTKDKTPNQQTFANKDTKNNKGKLWQRPFSLVASVGFLGVLLITQRDYFVHPNNIVSEDADRLNAPVMQTPDSSKVARLTQEITAVQSFEAKKTQATTQKSELLFDKGFITVERKKLSVMPASKLLKEQMLDKSILEDNSAKTSPMSLSDMSKLAALLKLELTMQNVPELDASVSRIKMQQSLFENLLQYQQINKKFKIPEEFLSVLTENQLQQLKH